MVGTRTVTLIQHLLRLSSQTFSLSNQRLASDKLKCSETIWYKFLYPALPGTSPSTQPLDQWPGCRGRGRTVTSCSFDTPYQHSALQHYIWSNIYTQTSWVARIPTGYTEYIYWNLLSCSDTHWVQFLLWQLNIYQTSLTPFLVSF